MFNYDIPWSIITLDQRNGRIDRFGQTKTPLIYYLIADSSSADVQGDIRIIERLKEKEEEVHKSLGDAGSMLGFYDQQQETNLVEQALLKGDSSILDTTSASTNEDDWLKELLNDAPAASKTIKPDEGYTSFYSDDFAYYGSLINELKASDDRLVQFIQVDGDEKVIEIEQFNELSRKGVLYDIPTEAFPNKKETFNLTTDAAKVEQSIAQARKKQNEWPRFQLLYDLNPIAKWMQFKLLGQVDRGKALVARLRDPLPKNSAWYVFQGVTSNQQGKPMFSKTFTVGKSLDGSSNLGNLESFEEFVQQYRLRDAIPEIEITDDHLSQLKSNLPEAVKSAKNIYNLKIQGDLEDRMEVKLELYQEKLTKWLTASESQMELKFGDEVKATTTSYFLNKRKNEVNFVKTKMEEFYNEYFQLENEPFLRVLAVFYNAD